MNYYSDLKLPTRGTSKKIFDALKSAGYSIDDLHYNANLWGHAREDGWGTWVCRISEGTFFCGVKNGRTYLQAMQAPYNCIYIVR